jgi:hypothetical protein
VQHLILLYYFAIPRFGILFSVTSEGHYWIINRNLIEALIMVIYLFMACERIQSGKIYWYFKGRYKKGEGGYLR